MALVVGQAISGAFLAHGMQANRILALEDPGVAVQVMSKRSTARVTRRSVEELDEIAKEVPATAYDVASFARLGALHRLIEGSTPPNRTRRTSRGCATRSPRRSLGRHDGSTDLSGRLAPRRPANTETRACESGSGSPRSGAVRPHDMLRLAGGAGLRHEGSVPAWVPDVAGPGAWVVVRRARAPAGLIPVGVRGAPARRRFAALLAPDAVAARVTPEDLAAARVGATCRARRSALTVLDAVDELCTSLGLAWGPTGSVGFELHRRCLGGCRQRPRRGRPGAGALAPRNAREIADHLNRLPAASTRNSTCRQGLWRWTSTPAAGRSCCARLTDAADPRPVAEAR